MLKWVLMFEVVERRERDRCIVEVAKESHKFFIGSSCCSVYCVLLSNFFLSCLLKTLYQKRKCNIYLKPPLLDWMGIRLTFHHLTTEMREFVQNHKFSYYLKNETKKSVGPKK